MSPHDPQRNPYNDPPHTDKKKGLSKNILIPILIVLALVIAVSAFLLQPGDISRQEAIDIAIGEVGGGRANRPERDFEDFQRVWSVEVFHDNLVFEVYVSRFTGEVVRVEMDR